MRIVYIGASDVLAETLTNRMRREGNDVYLLSDKPLPQKQKGKSKFRFYRNSRKGKDFEELLRSISPDCIIFAGNNYISGTYGEETDDDVTLLTWSLRAAATFPHVKFILLSSVEVYGNTEKKVDETAEMAALDERGMRFICEEQLLDIYQKQHNMDAVVLRGSHLYSNKITEGAGDFLSRSFFVAVQTKSHIKTGVYQPLHITDFVDAVKKVLDNGTQRVYNISGSNEVSAEKLYQMICKHEKLKEQTVEWEESDCVALADSSRIRQELNWTDSQNLEEQLEKGEITYERVLSDSSKQRRQKILTAIRKCTENIFIFAAFFAINHLCDSNNMFSHINWLLIYVILISVSYSIYQSALAVILAGGAYLLSQNISFFELNSFNSYADVVLAIMEFVFLGFIVSYTANTLREKKQNISTEYEILQKEYDDLRSINDENVLIKREYEERLLTSNSGLPKLYNLISRLMVQESDHILLESMQVISELLRTDTVAVYQGKAGSPWLRLVGALSQDSAMEGKSWNVSANTKIYDAVMQGKLFQGELGKDEPAVVLPIFSEVVVVIKTLPYESETLYHTNLLKTMALLLRDSMEKAMQYEELLRGERYVDDTSILKPEAFRKQIHLAEEKAEKCVAEYCVVKLEYSGSLSETSENVGQALRITDCLGIDDKGNFFALLNNTGVENLKNIKSRFLACGIDDWSVIDKPLTI